MSLTCMVEGGVLATESPCPEKFVLEIWGFARYILKKFLFLGPDSEVLEPDGAFGPLPRRSLLQRQ